MAKRLIAVALGVALAFPGAASATFPGRDGRLAAVYSVSYAVSCEPHECEQSRQRYVTTDPRGRREHVLFGCDPCDLSPLEWSRNGRHVAWSYAGSVWTSNAGGGTPRKEGPYNVDPAWQPAGLGLALWSSGGKLGVIDSAGAVRPLADGSGPTWCANGTIVFVGYDHWLMSIQPDGTRLGRISRSVYGGPPDCSPDGRSVIFHTGNHLYASAIRGRSVRRIPAPVRADSPVWSPSGRRVAWSDGRDVWVARRDGSHARNITRGPHRGQYLEPSWQPLP